MYETYYSNFRTLLFKCLLGRFVTLRTACLEMRSNLIRQFWGGIHTVGGQSQSGMSKVKDKDKAMVESAKGV